MNHIETMKQALDALEGCAGRDEVYNAIQSLRAAIAQGESEPVGYFIQGGPQWYQAAPEYKDDSDVLPLYTAPQVADYVPLSDEQIDECMDEAYRTVKHGRDLERHFARAIERAVRGVK